MSIKKNNIEFLKPHFRYKDSRGTINGIFNNYKIEEVNVITSKANTLRGRHYHTKTIEILHVVKGELQLFFSSIKNTKKILKKINVKEGQTVTILPYQFHWSYNKKKAQWINFLTKRFNQKKPDIYN